MPDKKKKILFVSHAASWSGAPLILLGIIKEFKEQSGMPFRILIMEDGALAKEFRALGPTIIWNKKGQSPSKKNNNFFSVFTKIPATIRRAYTLLQLRDTSLVFFNTISNGHIQKKLSVLPCKSICYVHELEAAIHMLNGSGSLKVVMKNTNYFLAGSEAVKRNLVARHQLNEHRIKVLYSSLLETTRNKSEHTGFIAEFKKKHAIPTSSIIIGVACSNEWRKGFDLFFPLVTSYFRLFPESDVYFIWKGYRESHLSYYDRYDLEKLEAHKRIILLPHGGDSLEHIACFDIHLLLSREDPYPVVVLEAASFGVPTVCFADSGGSPEFIEEDSGFCVPYGDLVTMATRLHELAGNHALREEMGSAGKEKVKRKHDKKDAAREVIETVKKILAEPAT